MVYTQKYSAQIYYSYKIFTFDKVYTNIWVFHDRLKPLANPTSPQLTHDRFSVEKMEGEKR